MTDIYIATKTQADYDALMRLAEAAGYMWNGNEKPTQFNAWPRLEGGTVINLVGNKVYYEPLEYLSSENCAIETIPNLAEIESVWKVKADVWEAFVNEYPDAKRFITHDYIVLIAVIGNKLEWCASNPYDALAVEYKPQESEVMPEKVKFPKEIFEALKEYGMPNYPDSADFYPLTELYSLDRFRQNPEAGEAQRVLGEFLRSNIDNQWKLIDALRNGYEAETEPHWGIKAGKCYMKDPENCGFDNIASQDAAYWTVKSAADAMIKLLGFGEVVDLNKEVDGNE